MVKDTSNNKRVMENSQDIARRGMMTIALGILFLIVVALGLMFFNNVSKSKYYSEEQFTELNSGWTSNIGGVRSSMSLPSEVEIKPEEELVIRKQLPSSITEYTAIVSRNYHMKMLVLVDGEEVYRYPADNKGYLSTVFVDDWNVINLRPEMASKNIEIRLTPSRAGFSGVIRPIYFGSGESIIRYLRDKYTLFFAMGISILAVGVLMLFLGLFYYKYDKDSTKAIVGIMLLITGSWLTNRSKMPVLGVGSAAAFLSCFLVLSLVPLAIGLYSSVRFPDKNRAFTAGVVGIDILFVFVIILALSMHYTILELALPVYLMMALNLIYVQYNLWGYCFGRERKLRSKRELLKDRIEFTTNTLTLIGFFAETVLYTDELMTEINMINRVSFNIYAVGHLAKLMLDSYNGVKDRNLAVIKLHESQVAMLMAQIQPHFIFNTLASIRTLIKVDPDTAYDMVYNFSNYLRANVDNMTNLSGIRFSAELGHIESYVNIEKVRFGDRVIVEYDIHAENFMVPPLSIQPLVENAIKHGICPKPEGGKVYIRSYTTDDYNVVEVQDNGIGLSQEKLNIIFGGSMEEEIGSDKRFDVAIIEETINASKLLDREGNPIEISRDIIANGEGNLTGNGSEQHVSSGVRNVILRLNEMSNASVEIESKEGEGTLFRVLFPLE